MHEGAEAQSVVDGLSMEDQALLHASTALLYTLHRTEGILEVNEPFGDDAPYPVDTFSLKPFYMNRTDPPSLGVWSIQVNDLRGRITSIPNNDGSYRLDVRGEHGSRPATVAEGTLVAQTLQYACSKWIEQGGLEDATARRQARAGGVLSRLLGRH